MAVHLRCDICGNPSDRHSDMTLRDWFAGQALAGFTSQHAHPKHERSFMTLYEYVEKIATLSYMLADSMLAARESEGGEET